MDRYQQLIEKRDDEGLTDQEADELGRLMAERRGKQYGNADDPPEDVEIERVGTMEATEEDVAELEKQKEEEKARQEEKAATPPKGTEQRPEEVHRADPPKPGTEGAPPA
ncbi:MAG: hypothetical protein ACRDKA_09980 [Actinomycetota bacterium]